MKAVRSMVVAAWCGLCAVQAHAQSSVSCFVSTEVRQYSPSWVQSGTGGSYASGCDSALNLASYGRAAGSVDVAPGVVKIDVSADSLGQNQQRLSTLKSTARGVFEDKVRINVPGAPAFAMGSITVSFGYDGFFQGGGASQNPGRGDAYACFYVTGFVNAGGFQCSINGILMQPNNPPPASNANPGAGIVAPGRAVSGLHSLTVPIRLNKDVELQFMLGVSVMTFDPQNSVVGAFGNSAYWGGISSVWDSNGKVLSLNPGGGAGTYSLVNSSGFDWHTSLIPIPEPSTWALMLVGTGMLLFLARRRRG